MEVISEGLLCLKDGTVPLTGGNLVKRVNQTTRDDVVNRGRQDGEMHGIGFNL